MAKFTVKDFIDVGTGGPLGAATCKVWKDKEKTILIDQSIFDEVNHTYWHSPLPKEDGSGDFYNDLEGFYVEVTLYFNIEKGVVNSGFASETYTMGPFSQRDEIIKITDGDKDPMYKTAKELGWFK